MAMTVEYLEQSGHLIAECRYIVDGLFAIGHQHSLPSDFLAVQLANHRFGKLNGPIIHGVKEVRYAVN